MNFMGFTLYKEKAVDRAGISGEADSEFIAETVSNSATVEFTFTPKAEGENNYLLSYELKKDGELISSKDKELITKISKDNPIAFSITRDSGSEYSLETTIYDTENPAHKLHSDQVVIYPQEEQASENNQEIEDLFSNYIEENINTLSPEEAVLGGSFYVTKIRFLNKNSAFVSYEDGHIALDAVVNFYLNDDKIEITSFEIEEDGVSFSETGNIVSGNGGREIIYEKPGKPALREALIFTDNSKCFNEGVDFACDLNYWENGNRVRIDGELKHNGVEVITLTMITESSQAVPHTDYDIDTCEERGGVIMFPDCVGCDPYCSFNEEDVTRRTLDDDICVDNCGNGTCEEIVCLGEGCPCAETADNCPEDCN
jgi:hypothetical protein